ncbi:hypothetical protein PSHI8_05770 [Polynucleobacter sp. SHI8]|uniref:DUF3306 domain-containing protein n=1 Tax=unclassified Polynucleobacter TaxID=2640945 RepID=UPI002493674E|nr:MULTISPECIES: DUF3306 domain-containing protein [unclassified Polynucleobacter]BDW10495.1 hypothetical protein PSHI2_05770 [Polynucleobacter sp. SHI2]BDW12941.1 hypothetical protein PSHI8_05770 [Polynucleobacter sp. SHI8]
MSNFFKRWSDLKQSQTKSLPIETPTEEQTEVKETLSPEVLDQQLVKDLEEKSITESVGPTLDDVERLNKDSDFSSFVNADVGEDVHHAAMKKLFSDPHYNIMDGLDIYIGDYSKEDPLPPGMLEKMVQSSMLGLFNKVEEKLPDLVLSENQPNLDVNEQALQVNHAEMEDVSQENQEDQITMTKGLSDDSDTRL